ncbi:MAG: hypothetical protein ACOC6P_04650, partial [Candidatus Aminicenantaceae bacterium]
MVKNIQKKILLVLFILLFGLNGALLSQDYSIAEVRKVYDAIRLIQREQMRKDRRSLQNIDITESELNSYIAYRIEAEKEKVMKKLKLKFLDENQIEGRVFIDLQGAEIPRVLQPQMNLRFVAVLKIKDEKARLHLKRLFLEGLPVPGMILDLVIYIASKIDNEKVSSFGDWYELPYGIKDVKIREGIA